MLGRIVRNCRRDASRVRSLARLRQLHINKTEKIFANAEVNLRDVEVMGFDYDFTLVSYTHQLQQLVYDTAKMYLCDHLSYPEELKRAMFDPTFCIRGLVFDLKNGNLLKLSSKCFNAI